MGNFDMARTIQCGSVWHKPLKMMHYNDFVITSTGYVAPIQEEVKGIDYMMRFNQQDLEFDKQCVVMQCTGLKDKNGKLIYEGDIVKYTSLKSKTNPDKKPYTENFKIAWENTYTGYNLQNAKGINCFNIAIARTQIEIIGNEHENPELLKGLENEN